MKCKNTFTDVLSHEILVIFRYGYRKKVSVKMINQEKIQSTDYHHCKPVVQGAQTVTIATVYYKLPELVHDLNTAHLVSCLCVNTGRVEIMNSAEQ